jgi:hypothetical protein
VVVDEVSRGEEKNVKEKEGITLVIGFAVKDIHCCMADLIRIIGSICI